MKTALVLGASGGMGYSIVKELSSRGVSVIAFARNKERLEKLFGNDDNVRIFNGDVFQVDDLKAAAKGIDVIFQSANIPYKDWEGKLVSFMTNIVETAKVSSAKFVMVENIYAYGRSTGRKVCESTEKNPHTKKGKIRLQVEGIVKNSGVEALIAHFPDFYGPNAENTILHFTLQNVVENKRASYVGNKQIAREFIYTPDGAKAIVELASNENAYGQNWNIPGVNVITGNEIVEIIREVSGYQKSVSTVSKNLIRLLGLFNANMREVVEMFYLNEEPVVLDGKKYESLIGPIPRTPYRKGLQETLDYMKGKIII